MAQEMMNDAEFWLPAEFLDDDFFLEGEPKSRGVLSGVTKGGCFAGEYPWGFGADLGSPVESVTEAESDEEDYLAGLSRQMAQTFLHVEAKDSSFFAGVNPKIVSGSPQSTLCAVDNWTGSNKSSPNGPSKVSSPPTTPFEQSNDSALDDLLYAAAGEVVRMRLYEQEQQQKLHGRGLLRPPKQPSAPMAAPRKKLNTGYYASPVPSLQQLKFEQLKQQQLIRQQLAAAWGKQQSTTRAGVYYGDERTCHRPLGLPPSAWPPLQQQRQQMQQQPPPPQPGSGMRAVFLNGTGARRESTGTGVFLPQRAGCRPEPRKKPACSTVLLPARVVQALNLNLEELNVNPRFSGGLLVDHNDVITNKSRGAPVLTQPQWNNHHRPQYAAPPPAHDFRLPPEWTY